MTREEFIKVFWKQYLLLEKEFIEMDGYISIDKENYDTFSQNYLKLFLAICSEIDSVAESICVIQGHNPKELFGIIRKINAIMEMDKNLRNCRVDMQFPYDIKNITPMAKFSEASSDWWKAYNDVKHHRVEKNENGRYNYTKANLKNTLYAITALYILNSKLYDRLESDGNTKEQKLRSALFESEIKL